MNDATLLAEWDDRYQSATGRKCPYRKAPVFRLNNKGQLVLEFDIDDPTAEIMQRSFGRENKNFEDYVRQLASLTGLEAEYIRTRIQSCLNSLDLNTLSVSPPKILY